MPIVGPGVIRLEALSADPSVLCGLTNTEAEEYDRRVRREACSQVAIFGSNLQVSVNVFPRCLRPEFVDEVAGLLDYVAPNLLTLEILETEPLQGREILSKLADMGVRLALDDCGRGYTTFDRVAEVLKWGVFHSLKACLPEIDKTVELAGGLEVVAEYVETRDDYERVISQGILAQGHYIAKKFPFHEFPAWLREWS